MGYRQSDWNKIKGNYRILQLFGQGAHLDRTGGIKRIFTKENISTMKD